MALVSTVPALSFSLQNWQRTAMSIPSATLVLRIAGLPLIPCQMVIFLAHLNIVWSDTLLTSLSQKTHQNVTRDGFSWPEDSCQGRKSTLHMFSTLKRSTVCFNNACPLCLSISLLWIKSLLLVMKLVWPKPYHSQDSIPLAAVLGSRHSRMTQAGLVDNLGEKCCWFCWSY